MNIDEAIQSPRFHDQLVGVTLLEKELMEKISASLKHFQYNITYKEKNAVVQGVLIDEDGFLQGASDWRKGGKPSGY